jgi:hypothetical protein
VQRQQPIERLLMHGKTGSISRRVGVPSRRVCQTELAVDEFDGAPSVAGVETADEFVDRTCFAPLPGQGKRSERRAKVQKRM